jgi:hypothetical protein
LNFSSGPGDKSSWNIYFIDRPGFDSYTPEALG